MMVIDDNCVSSCKVIPQALFAMVCRLEQEYAAHCSGILCLLLLRNRGTDRSKIAAAFLAPSSQCAYVYSL